MFTYILYRQPKLTSKHNNFIEMKLATAIVLSFASSATAFTAPQVSFRGQSVLEAKKARPKLVAGKKAAAPAKKINNKKVSRKSSF